METPDLAGNAPVETNTTGIPEYETVATNPNHKLQAPVTHTPPPFDPEEAESDIDLAMPPFEKGTIFDCLRRVREASGNAWASVPDAAKEIAEMRCGPTHCHGCDCHEASRNSRIAELEEAVALLREECGAAWQYMIETRLINASTEITHRRYKAAREACKLKGLS